MIKIIDCEDGKKRFVDSCDESIYRTSFARIEQMHSCSNYYMLWRELDSTGFYLYNSLKGRYALTGYNIDSLTESREFLKIVEYSDVSKSFVAYRKDNGLAYLFFEDGNKGEIGERGESYIGKEHHGKRAVQNPRGEWVFFDCLKRCIVPHFHFKNHKNPLGRWLCGNHFTTRFENHLSITQYREDDSFRNVPGYFNEIEEFPNDYIVASEQSNDRLIYVLIRDAEIIGKFINKPIYDEEHCWFKGKKENQWYLVKKGYELTHYNWENDDFKFIGNFILNKSSDKGWLIYDPKTGDNVCQDWHNIRIDETATTPFLLVDTDTLLDYHVGIAEVEAHMNELRQVCSDQFDNTCDTDDIFNVHAIEIEDYIQIPNSEDDEVDGRRSETFQDENTQNIQLKKEYVPYYDFECNNIMPQHIHHIAFPQSFIKGRRSFKSELTVKNVSLEDYVCWVFVDDNAIVITQRDPSFKKWHNCIFRKVFDSSNFLKKRDTYPLGIKRIDFQNVSENNIINEIEKWLVDFYGKKKEKVQAFGDEKDVATTEESEASVANNTANKPSVIEKSDIDGSGITATIKNNQIVGSVSLKGNTFSLGTKSPIHHIFGNKHYRILDCAMIVMIDDSNLVKIDYNGHLTRHYNIIGEGQDFRFSQEFNKNNIAIRDNEYPIFIFKQIDNECCELIDQVICCDYTIANQSRKADKFCNSRKVINFELESLWHFNTWKIQ